MQATVSSKLTDKAQTTIPKAVRRLLHLEPGDSIGYLVDADGTVTLTKVQSASEQDPFATFSEWSSPEDEAAYANL